VPYDEIAVSEQVLDYGLPSAPALLQPGESAPIARWQRGEHGAVLHLRRLRSGERDVDLVVLVLVAGRWQVSSAYLGWEQRARLLQPRPRRSAEDTAGTALRRLWTTVHRPHLGGVGRTLWISQYLAESWVDHLRVDYPDGSDLLPVRVPGVVIVGHTDVEPVLTPVRARTPVD